LTRRRWREMAVFTPRPSPFTLSPNNRAFEWIFPALPMAASVRLWRLGGRVWGCSDGVKRAELDRMGGNNAGVWPKRKRVSPHKNGGVDATDRPPLSSNFAVIGSLGCLLGRRWSRGGAVKTSENARLFHFVPDAPSYSKRAGGIDFGRTLIGRQNIDGNCIFGCNGTGFCSA